MKTSFAFILLSCLAISAAGLFIFKGGRNMSLLSKDTEASIGLPSLDTHISVTFETATFALG